MTRPPTPPSPADTASISPAAPTPGFETSTPALETVLRRLLRAPAGPPTATDNQAHRLFSASIAISALRCLLSYIVLPVLIPLIGPTTGSSPAIGIPLSVVALVFDVRAVRRFWLAEHRWRWKITALYALVMILIVGLLIDDIIHALS
jgi:hypothetical protein